MGNSATKASAKAAIANFDADTVVEIKQVFHSLVSLWFLVLLLLWLSLGDCFVRLARLCTARCTRCNIEAQRARTTLQAARATPHNKIDRESFLEFFPLPGKLGEALFDAFDQVCAESLLVFFPGSVVKSSFACIT